MVDTPEIENQEIQNAELHDDKKESHQIHASEETIDTVSVSSTTSVKEIIQTSTYYNITLKDHKEIKRKFADFLLFRKKLLERWTGIYIPNIPHKISPIDSIITIYKISKQKHDDRLVKYRRILFEKFMKRVFKLGYIKDSKEFEIFVSESIDVEKHLEAFKKDSTEATLERFLKTFSDFDESFNVEANQIKILEFKKFIETSLNNIKFLKEKINKIYLEKDNEIEILNEIFASIKNFEKYCLYPFEHNEQKLIFSNGEIVENLEKIKGSLINPYIELLEWLEDEEIDNEAILESIDSVNIYFERRDKLSNKVRNLIKEIDEKKDGKKSSIKTILKIKSKEEIVNELENEKNVLNNEIDQLSKIIAICYFNFNRNLDELKKVKMQAYYNMMKQLSKVQSEQSEKIKHFWDLIQKDHNLNY